MEREKARGAKGEEGENAKTAGRWGVEKKAMEWKKKTSRKKKSEKQNRVGQQRTPKGQ